MSLKLSQAVPKGMVSKFAGLQTSLAKASLKITFQAYVGLMVLSSIVAGIITFSMTLLISANIIFAFLIGLLCSVSAFGITYMYPQLSISSKTRRIDASLALTANFMAVLASSGMPPERIFRSLANVGDEFGLGEEVPQNNRRH